MAASGDESSRRTTKTSRSKKKKLERSASAKVFSSGGSISSSKPRSSSKVRSSSKPRQARSKSGVRTKSTDSASVSSKIRKEKSKKKLLKSNNDEASSAHSRRSSRRPRRSSKIHQGHDSSDDEDCIILPDFDDMSLGESPVEKRGRSYDRSNLEEGGMVVSRTPSVGGGRRERLTVTRTFSGASPNKSMTSPGGSSSSGRRSSMNDASNMLLKMQQAYKVGGSDSDEDSTGLIEPDDMLSVGSYKRKQSLSGSPSNPFAPKSMQQSQKPETPDGNNTETTKNKGKGQNPFVDANKISVAAPVKGNPFMEEEQRGYVAPTQSSQANKKDDAMDVDLSLNERLAAGEQLTRERALELTVDKMRQRLEENEIERSENHLRIKELEETVRSQEAKIKALEYYFRKMQEKGTSEVENLNSLIAEERANSATAAANHSGGGYFSFGFGGHKTKQEPVAPPPPASPGREMVRNIYATAADKDFEIEDEAPGRLSTSFQKAGAKVRRAKAEAAGRDEYIS